MKLFQINTVLNYGSTGRIVEQLGLIAESYGWESKAAHGIKYLKVSHLDNYTIGNKRDLYIHEIKSALIDSHGLASDSATNNLITEIVKFNPDIIHLHNLHGYYLNYPILFNYLSSVNTPVVWTLHDCWPFTGHCSHFDFIGCDRWKTGCGNCPGLSIYPRSLFVDQSKRNYLLKQRCFTSIIDRLTLVPVSYWLESLVSQSFLKDASIRTIHNGVDTNLFCPRNSDSLRARLNLGNKKVVLGVAQPWTIRKGYQDMLNLANLLPHDSFQVILVGLTEKQIDSLPKNILGVKRTNSQEELSEYYSLASVFVNPTYEDNFPTTNLEALACGTPVITYNTGGSPEAIDSDTGRVIDKGDINSLIGTIGILTSFDREKIRQYCRSRATSLFNKDDRYADYIQLYHSLI